MTVSCVLLLNHVCLFVNQWTIFHHAPLCMEFFRQEYWSQLPFPSPGDLPDPGTEPVSAASPTLAGGLFDHCTTWEAQCDSKCSQF